MKVLLAVASLLACCLAQAPRRCRAPPFLSGELTVTTQNGKVMAVGKYEYDALGRRLRLSEMGTYGNKSFTFDILLNYRQHVLYEIDTKARSCKKVALKGQFQPWEVPQEASLLGQAILGSSSGPGQGLLVNTWTGEVKEEGIQYISTITEFGCIPVSSLIHTDQYGWMVSSLFNNVIGITDPGKLNPPDYCPSADVKTEEEPRDFLSLFRDRH